MGRPTNEQIRALAIKCASREDGACDLASTQLLNLCWSPYDSPEHKERIAVYIKESGYARNHWALSATWAGDDEATIIDNTIGQFGGDEMVFVGSLQEWLAALRAHFPNVSIEVDPGAKRYRAALLAEFDPNAVHYDDEPMLNFLPKNRTETHAARDDHIFEALTASKTRRSSGNSGSSAKAPANKSGSRRCTLF